MNLSFSVTQSELLEVLLNVAPVQPVFIWGAPGIGKSAMVEKFANEVGPPEDNLRVKREYGFLIPRGKRLPFRPKGKVFYFRE